MADDDRLKKLEEQRAELDRRIRAQRAKIKDEERRRATRRKIILGGLIERHCELNPESPFAREVERLVAEFVTGETERALFDLAPLPEGKAPVGAGDKAEA
jgi:FKBP-type peptidyl-prolyl cis-trans isomerase (trigger factor)